jgi:hypothetical protein
MPKVGSNWYTQLKDKSAMVTTKSNIGKIYQKYEKPVTLGLIGLGAAGMFFGPVGAAATAIRGALKPLSKIDKVLYKGTVASAATFGTGVVASLLSSKATFRDYQKSEKAMEKIQSAYKSPTLLKGLKFGATLPNAPKKPSMAWNKMLQPYMTKGK